MTDPTTLTWSSLHQSRFAVGGTSSQWGTILGSVMGNTSPAASINIDVAKVQAELRALCALEEDWDGEDAEPVDPQAINTAQQLMRRIARRTLPWGYGWLRPKVAPMRDGGVSLTWRFAGNLLWLIVEPGGNNVIFISRDQQLKPSRRALSPDEAAGQLLLALGA